MVVKAVVLDLQSRPGEPTNISVLSAVKVLHEPQSVCEKDDAPLNMRFMLVTLDTSHLDMSVLKHEACKNMACMLVTLDTSHLEMSPL